MAVYCCINSSRGYECDCTGKRMVSDKPPIGLKPKEIHDRARKEEIPNAMMRYVAADKEIPQSWLDELYSLIS